jgi:hypothetical protein
MKRNSCSDYWSDSYRSVCEQVIVPVEVGMLSGSITGGQCGGHTGVTVNRQLRMNNCD